MVNITFIVVLVLIAAVWLIIEFKRFRHKILAVFLVLLILFTYFSFSSIVKRDGLDLKSPDGLKEAGKVYVLWLGNAFKNVKVITANAVNLSWIPNKSSEANETLKSNSSKI